MASNEGNAPLGPKFLVQISRVTIRRNSTLNGITKLGEGAIERQSAPYLATGGAPGLTIRRGIGRGRHAATCFCLQRFRLLPLIFCGISGGGEFGGRSIFFWLERGREGELSAGAASTPPYAVLSRHGCCRYGAGKGGPKCDLSFSALLAGSDSRNASKKSRPIGFSPRRETGRSGSGSGHPKNPGENNRLREKEEKNAYVVVVAEGHGENESRSVAKANNGTKSLGNQFSHRLNNPAAAAESIRGNEGLRKKERLESEIEMKRRLIG